ncbi:MAG: 2-hydroxyglutaryl-CoA dehydratase [Ruminococcaceae bacterium]|nr:2-hydroxyglutaryl-CoA dehydratase [Oscillospiraceae bacterium]
MQDKSFVPFTEDMKRDYTILVPNMLPMHFRLIAAVMKTHGYNMQLLETSGPEIAQLGLKYTHNDTCYPAILVIGQFMHALQSGKYDPEKTALIMFQTGGGCRASNYISLIRKALKKNGMEHIPVISLSLAGIEKHPGFKLNIKVLRGMIYGVLCGDLLMSLVNQVRPYELEPGAAEALADRWTQRLAQELGSSGKINYRRVRARYREIVADFAAIPVERREAVKVGVVGEIFVKYSPLGNNDLERFLISEGAEVVVPGLLDFCLYSVYDAIMEYKVYGKRPLKYAIFKFAFNWLNTKRRDISDEIERSGCFEGWTPFEHVVALGDTIINTTVKMGEGWLLPAEMLELIESGCPNIVCTQPFGCLPNHICGKGMMKPIKELYPQSNVIAIDYDAGASRVNQENRIKLMLSNARTAAAAAQPPAPSAAEETKEACCV